MIIHNIQHSHTLKGKKNKKSKKPIKIKVSFFKKETSALSDEKESAQEL